MPGKKKYIDTKAFWKINDRDHLAWILFQDLTQVSLSVSPEFSGYFSKVGVSVFLFTSLSPQQNLNMVRTSSLITVTSKPNSVPVHSRCSTNTGWLERVKKGVKVGIYMLNLKDCRNSCKMNREVIEGMEPAVWFHLGFRLQYPGGEEERLIYLPNGIHNAICCITFYIFFLWNVLVSH